MEKASVQVGYSGGIDGYRTWGEGCLTGADIEAKDGKGNTIKVFVREGDIGYRITLNGKDIAEG